MKYIELLSKQLQSDAIIELLEFWDADVVYDFDRLREGTADSYTVSCHEHGIELRFDSGQSLQTIFLHVTPRNGFSAAELTNSDVEVFDSRSDVAAHATTKGWQTLAGEATFLGIENKWIRMECEVCSVHYQFRDGLLDMITIMGTPP
ncbi:hypothetical protein NG895_10910 [Aeoliella sp. ICT_H6.2]|uniref:Uncharacterized protein n=1 Tax=Aeoliella straminimaris TaxID=2954799 RepID=A0A9X2FH38_9BACT|nr:hypothetical protein [Aeoliella straminimaris]MCO6044416.1 hypothetical protein [Aeoliella straminimaris]